MTTRSSADYSGKFENIYDRQISLNNLMFYVPIIFEYDLKVNNIFFQISLNNLC